VVGPIDKLGDLECMKEGELECTMDGPKVGFVLGLLEGDQLGTVDAMVLG